MSKDDDRYPRLEKIIPGETIVYLEDGRHIIVQPGFKIIPVSQDDIVPKDGVMVGGEKEGVFRVDVKKLVGVMHIPEEIKKLLTKGERDDIREAANQSP